MGRQDDLPGAAGAAPEVWGLIVAEVACWRVVVVDDEERAPFGLGTGVQVRAHPLVASAECPEVAAATFHRDGLRSAEVGRRTWDAFQVGAAR